MLIVQENDRAILEAALNEKGLTEDAVWDISNSGFVRINLPSFNDEQDVLDELDFHGVGFSYTH